MKKTLISTIILTIITIFAFTSASLACVPGDPCWKQTKDQEALSYAVVWDNENSKGGGIAGGAVGDARAQGTKEANATTNARSGMGSSYQEYSSKYEKEVSIHNDGYVSSGAMANARDCGNALAYTSGILVQDGRVDVGDRQNGAGGTQQSFGTYMSGEIRNGTMRPGAETTGSVTTYGNASAWNGSYNGYKWAGAEVNNGVLATGDRISAGGSGSAHSVSTQQGANAGSNASFRYNGNGSGMARSTSYTDSWRHGDYSYKEAGSSAYSRTSKF